MSARSKFSQLSATFTLLFACVATALSQTAGPNGHFYQVIMEPGLLWEEARDRAAEATFNGVHGHLATITSAEEDQYIETLRQQAAPGGYGSLWIGGFQSPYASNATDGWSWINGEGSIPMNVQEGYAHWQPGEPNDYSGPLSENYLSTGHFNQFGWNDETNGRHIHGYVVEYPSGGMQSTVAIEAIDPVAVENAPDSTAPVDAAVFEFTRTGDLSLDLPVFYSLHGTASNGIDYNEIARTISIPAGQTSVQLHINPRADTLAVVEKMETVGIRIEPSLILTPSAAYRIDENNREASAVIFENSPPPSPAIEIAVPKNGFTYKFGEVVKILAVVSAPEAIAAVDFYAGEVKIGTAARSAHHLGLSFFELSWVPPMAGSPDLYAKVTIGGSLISSSAVRIIIEQPAEVPVVSIRYVEGPVPAIVPPMDYTAGWFEFSRSGSTARNLQVFYNVSGSATADLDYERLQGYVVIAAGKTNARVNIAVKQDSIFEPTETVIAYLVPVEHSVDPTSPSIYLINPNLNNATLPIFDTGPAPQPPATISITAHPLEIEEPALDAAVSTRLTITRTSSLELAQRVYLSYDGTATPGVDYGRTPTDVLIPAGSSNVFLTMAALSDGQFEGTEYAIVRIARPNFPTDPNIANREYQISPERGSVRITILDAQDGPVLPMVSIWPVALSTHEPSSNMDVAPAVFELRRTGSTNTPLVVSLSYSGTASNNADYPNPGQLIEFKAGQRAVGVEIHAKDDQIVEGTETIVVQLVSLPSGAPPQYEVDPEHKAVTLTIIDNDSPTGEAVVSIQATDRIATELSPLVDAIDPARFVITRSGNTGLDLRVFFSVHGTAKPGEDYQALPTSVVIPAGHESVSLEIMPISDMDGGDRTNHYEIIPAAGISWEQARAQAESATYQGVHGHLATITSAKEDELIEALRQQAGGQVLWVGGYQEPGETSITEGWKWVNNEGPIAGNNSGQTYANWLSGEPNDYWGAASENHMVIGWLNSFGWNDQNPAGAAGYVVEFDLPSSAPSQNEPMETVALRLQPSPLAGPLPAYTINNNRRTDVAVIFDRQPPVNGAVEIAFPSSGELFPNDDDVEFFAAAFHPTVDLNRLTYYILGQQVGVSELPSTTTAPPGGLKVHYFDWDEAYPGTFVLQAKAQLPNNEMLTSSNIPFQVRDGTVNHHPEVTVVRPTDGSIFIVGDAVEVVAEGSDLDGSVIRMNLLVDGELTFSTNAARLAYVLRNLAAGPHTLDLRAVDNQGAGGSKVVNILVRHADAISFVQRELPAGYSPGVGLVVQLRANPRPGTFAYAVEDRPPLGWTVSAISDEGAFDPSTGKVKFGPFTDSEDRLLSYRVTPPTNAAGRQRFEGRSSANGASFPITGDEFIEPVQRYHPADQVQNFTIVLEEVTAYAAAWKTGESWPSGPVPIPLSYVTRAGTIWKRGEEYYFDATKPAPICWVPTSENSGVFSANATLTASRLISGGFIPGQSKVVQLTVSPAAGTGCYALEEKPPRGWSVSNVSGNGVFDERLGTIRWGVYMDSTVRTFNYTLTPPSEVSSVGTFSGHVSYDGHVTAIGASNSAVAESAATISITETRRTESGIMLHITGPSGQAADVEWTSDFVTWTNIGSIFIPGGSIEFTDPAAGDAPRFYRLRVQ